MVVEDDPTVRETLEQMLAAGGYAVDAFSAGSDALAHLRGNPAPCLILLDLMLLDMDAFEFRKEQQRDEALASVPVVIVSGARDIAAISTALHAAAFLQKPFDVPALLAVVAGTRRPPAIPQHG